MNKPLIGWMILEDHCEDMSQWDGHICFPNPTGSNLAWENPVKMIEFSAYEKLKKECEELRALEDRRLHASFKHASSEEVLKTKAGIDPAYVHTWEAGRAEGYRAGFIQQENFEKMDKEFFIQIIEKWKSFWMNQTQNSEEDRENYFSRALGVDANMKYHLAELIVKNIGGKA